MAKEQAFKLLALQEGTSKKKAKEMIDRGWVFVGDKQVKIARALMDSATRFRVLYPEEPQILFEDARLIAVNKPAQILSEEIPAFYPGTILLHRLDRDTSGVLLLAKEEAFAKKAIGAFKKQQVEKTYVAWVEGRIAEPMVIEDPIHTIKKGKAFSRIDPIRGKRAYTELYPEEIQGRKSKVRIHIKTGRTHQIRVHLASRGHPIVGDAFYGSVTQSKRILLHALRIALLGYEIEAPEPADILRYK